MSMSKIRIKFLTDEALGALRGNIDKVTEKLIEYPDNSSWLQSFVGNTVYTTKNYEIEDFELEVPSSSEDTETDIKNSIILYEHLRELPPYILADERFWNWINFEKGYRVALAYMPIKSGAKRNSVFKDHWLFCQGVRRGLMFGVLSRCYYRIALSYDETLADPYELGKFVIERPERFRNLVWRDISGNKNVIRGALKAEKAIVETYKIKEKTSYYTELAKDISKLGSIMLVDVMTEEDIREYVYNKYYEKIREQLGVIGMIKRVLGAN